MTLSTLFEPGRSRVVRAFSLLLLLLAVAPLSPAGAQKEEKPKKLDKAAEKRAVAALPENYRVWLDEVAVLITPQERAAFLALDKDYQRDAFIKRFWEVRDRYSSTARNEFHDRWKARVAEARSRYRNLKEDRARIFLLNGPPAGFVEGRCSNVIWPVEVWYYNRSDLANFEFIVVFFQRWGAGDYRIWQPLEGLGALFVDGTQAGRTLDDIANGCRDGDRLAGAISWVARQGMGYSMLQARFDARPDPPGGEWLAEFGSYSTDLPEAAQTFSAKLDFAFPGRYQNRTVVQGVMAVPAAEVTQAKIAEHRSYNFSLTGEVLEKGKLFDRFRYKFDFPGGDSAEVQGGSLPLVFQRYLRPGDFTVILKLEDLNSGKLFRVERPLSVPRVEELAPPPPPSDPETARILEEANRALGTGETTLKIVPPRGDLQTGMVRFDTLSTGATIDRVTFSLDGKPVLTKKKPPFSVELDLGSLPRTRTLAATAYDAAGNVLTGDELLINSSGHRFDVRLVEPRKGKRYEKSLLAQAEVLVPEGQTLERVEFFLNEERVATVYQAPFTQPILLDKDAPLTYVQTVAYLADGNSTYDLVFVNNPEIEEVDVQYVELYTTILDRAGRPVEGLAEGDFTVFEDGVKQEILRFDKVEDLPIHAAIALDVSASMEGSIDEAKAAALQFFQQTIKPKDRAAFIPFNDRPALAVKFTGDLTKLAGGLAGLKAERGTALWDTVVFCLYYFNGVKGQRALLLLSDGKDEGSRFSYEDALDYARRAGVGIYVIGLGEDIDKKKLARIAEETGGRGFFVKNAAELPGIYAAIEKELRSQYLVAYQSSNTGGGTEFRAVDLKVARSGLEVKTMKGYYP